MANKDFNDVQAPETEVKLLTGYFTAVNGSDPTVVSGCISSAVRTAEGVWTCHLKDAYPAYLFGVADVQGSAGDVAHVNMLATATVATAGTIEVNAWTKGGTADDVDAKRVGLFLVVRNSTSRRAT